MEVWRVFEKTNKTDEHETGIVLFVLLSVLQQLGNEMTKEWHQNVKNNVLYHLH